MQSEIETFFNDAPAAALDRADDLDKGHGRLEQRTVTVAHEVDWLDGDRRFPGELRLPDAATIIRVEATAELKDRLRSENRYYISSKILTAEAAAHAVREHWSIENAQA